VVFFHAKHGMRDRNVTGVQTCALPISMFVISAILLQLDFNILWRYFSWANQSTAVIALFVGAKYLYVSNKNYWISLLPGIFMLRSEERRVGIEISMVRCAYESMK